MYLYGKSIKLHQKPTTAPIITRKGLQCFYRMVITLGIIKNQHCSMRGKCRNMRAFRELSSTAHPPWHHNPQIPLECPTPGHRPGVNCEQLPARSPSPGDTTKPHWRAMRNDGRAFMPWGCAQGVEGKDFLRALRQPEPSGEERG